MLLAICTLRVSEPAKSTTADAHQDRVESCLPPPVLLQGEARSAKALVSRMAELKIPGVRVAVVHNDSIAWASEFCVAGPDGRPVTESTLFQAGSICTWSDFRVSDDTSFINPVIRHRCARPFHVCRGGDNAAGLHRAFNTSTAGQVRKQSRPDDRITMRVNVSMTFRC